MAVITSAVILEPKKKKKICHCSIVSPSTCHKVMEMKSWRWWNRRMCAHLLLWELQNYNSLLNNRQQENVRYHQKKIPHGQGHRRSPSKIVGGVKSHLESNPLPTRDTQRAQTNLCTPGLRDPTATDQNCVWVSPVETAVACCRGRGCGCSQPG